jgi:NAD+ kinase
MKIAIITNLEKDKRCDAAIEAARILSDAGAEIILSNNQSEHFRGMIPGAVSLDYSEIFGIADAAVILGGDGTILDIAEDATAAGCPILCINLGTVGYMSGLEMTELHLLPKLISGDYTLCGRMTLAVSKIVADGEIVFSPCALNDAVISRSTLSRIVNLKLYADGKHVSSYRADGLILSTPTGSTAYSMSAGGPIVDPKLACICVTPICSHSLSAHPMIFEPETEFIVENADTREKFVYLTVDGKSRHKIMQGEKVRIVRSILEAKFINLKGNGFFEVLREKLKSGSDI